MTKTAATIKSGDTIIIRGLVREVLSARTFGGRTDITLCGLQSRYNTSQVQFDANREVEVA